MSVGMMILKGIYMDAEDMTMEYVQATSDREMLSNMHDLMTSQQANNAEVLNHALSKRRDTTSIEAKIDAVAEIRHAILEKLEAPRPE